MPYVEIGREVTRGTICRDRWRADVVVACSDVIVPGGISPLAVRIRWRTLGDADGPTRPEDAAPITLRLRKASEAATGEIRFDGPAGDLERGFANDTDALLRLHGVTETAGSEADVVLEIVIEEQVRETILLAVRTPERRLQIRGAGGGRAPDIIAPARRTTFRASFTPVIEGAIRWISLGADALRIEGSATGAEVVVVGREGGAGDQAICAIHLPEDDGPVVVAAHRLAILAGARVEPPIGPTPGAAVVVAAGWSHPTTPANREVTIVALIDGGTPGQRVTFEIGGIIGPGSTILLERFDIPLGEDGEVTVPWTVPERLPGIPAQALGFTVSIGDAVSPSGTHPSDDRAPELHAEISLETSVEITLTDSLGIPLTGIAYELQRNGVVVPGSHGVTGADGEITVPDLPSEEYILILHDAVVLDAEEPEVEPRIPSPENTVFSLVDVRSAAPGEVGS